MFWEKSVLKILSKFTGEHPCRRVISIKLLCNFIEITLYHGCSSVICCIFSEHLFLRTHLECCFYILQLHWNKVLQHKCFLMNFGKYLRQLFYRTPPGNCFCPTEKYFTNKIVKNPLRKEKKWKQLVRKTTTRAKLNHYLHQVFISYSTISLIFSQLPMILKTWVLRNNAIPLRIYLL